MKSNIKVTNGMISKKTVAIDKVDKILQEEWDRRVDEVYKSAVQDAGNQILAVLFTALHKDFGFGKDRLLRVKKSMESYFALMNEGVFHEEFTPQDCIDYIRDNFGIDIDREGMLNK